MGVAQWSEADLELVVEAAPGIEEHLAAEEHPVGPLEGHLVDTVHPV